MPYRPEIDGLRALAVLAVLLFHLAVPGFEGGFVGVDIFFVISGFLITRIIRADITANKFTFRRFYLRRLRRLGPALLFTLTVSFAAAVVLFSADNLKQFCASLTAAVLSISNIYFWQTSSYFSAAAETKPLLHTWSLGVEEQFYLVWPLCLLLLSRWSKSYLAAFLIVTGVLSLALAVAFRDHVAASFFLSPTRAYEFVLGAALVWAEKDTSPRTSNALFLAGFTLIAVATHLFTPRILYPSAAALVPCLGAALIIQGGSSGIMSRVLNNPVSIGLGLISYSLYLIHWPIIVFYRSFSGAAPSTVAKVVIVLSSVTAAALIYRFIETPFRRPGKSPSSSRYLLTACAASVTLLVVPSMLAYSHDGWPRRINKRYDNDAAYAGGGIVWTRSTLHAGALGDVILYGDSHAKQYFAALSQLTSTLHYNLKMIAHPACMALPGLLNVYPSQQSMRECRTLLAKLRAQRNAKMVIIAFRYSKRLIEDGVPLDIDAEQSPERYAAHILKRIDLLMSNFDQDTQFIIIGNVPTARLPHGYPACANRMFKPKWCHESFAREQGEFYGAISSFDHFSQSHSNVTYINPYDSLCDDKVCYVVRNHVLYYSDHAHLTALGARKVIFDHGALIAKALAIPARPRRSVVDAVKP